MPIDDTALSSLAATLSEVTERIGRLAAEAGDDEDDRGELVEVERQLQTATRRLEKIVRRATRGR